MNREFLEKLSKLDLPKQDPIVQKVIDKYIQRSQVGIKKYGTTLEENNNDNYLLHLQHELMDASLYIEKLLSKLENNESYVKNK